jgi:ATP-dependent Zn protease
VTLTWSSGQTISNTYFEGEDMETVSEKRAVCYHEAGHAVVRAHFQHAIDGATVVPNEEQNTLGCVTSQGLMLYDANVRRRVTRESILSAYAGLEAEKLVNPDYDPDQSVSDFDLAFELLRKYPGRIRGCSYVGDDVYHARLEYYRKESAKLVRHLWPVIERVALALEERDTLTADEIYVIYDEAQQ